MKFIHYGNSGSIDDVKRYIKEKERYGYNSLGDMLYSVLNSFESFIGLENLVIKPYSYDERIESFVYMISSYRFGSKQYKHPIFIRYFIEV